MRLISIFIKVLLISLVFSNPAYSQSKLYWSTTENDNSIYRSNLDGSSVEKIIDGNLTGRDTGYVVVDDVGSKIYWVNASAQEIRRANLDGSSDESVLNDLNGIVGLNIDILNRKLYWINTTNNTICRSGVNGEDKECTPNYFAFEVVVGPTVTPPSLFFVTTPPGINQGPLTPFGGTDTAVTNDGTMVGVHFLHGMKRLFWFFDGGPHIRYRDLSSGDDNLFLDMSGGGDVSHFANDREEDFLYWSETTPPRIRKSTIENPAAQDLLTIARNASGLYISCGILAPDTDADGHPDCDDRCPADATKFEVGNCGCGKTETPDTDGDGTFDCNDQCPADSGKSSAGQCGCGVKEDASDADKDGTINCLDQCLNDSNKITPGVCGCGFTEVGTGSKSACTDNSEVDPKTKIDEPPDIEINDDTNTVTLIFEQFDKAVLKKKKIKPSLFAPLVLSKAKEKITFRYSVTIQNTQKKKDVKQITTKKNELAVKNLKPGNYNASYRVEILKDGEVAGRTNLSPKANFTIQ